MLHIPYFPSLKPAQKQVNNAKEFLPRHQKQRLLKYYNDEYL